MVGSCLDGRRVKQSRPSDLARLVACGMARRRYGCTSPLLYEPC
ncbi:hypothetical protein [Micromonospora chersina]